MVNSSHAISRIEYGRACLLLRAIFISLAALLLVSCSNTGTFRYLDDGTLQASFRPKEGCDLMYLPETETTHAVPFIVFYQSETVDQDSHSFTISTATSTATLKQWPVGFEEILRGPVIEKRRLNVIETHMVVSRFSDELLRFSGKAALVTCPNWGTDETVAIIELTRMPGYERLVELGFFKRDAGAHFFMYVTPGERVFVPQK